MPGALWWSWVGGRFNLGVLSARPPRPLANLHQRDPHLRRCREPARFGLRALGFGSRVSSVGHRVSGLRYRVSGAGGT